MSGHIPTLLERVEIIDTKFVNSALHEVCVSGEATYDEVETKLSVKLDAFVRRVEMRGKDVIFRPPWLPRPDHVEMRASREEASDAAKDIFRNWAKKVSKVIPGTSEWTPDASWLVKPSTDQPQDKNENKTNNPR
jgi:hypothetical protein